MAKGRMCWGLQKADWNNLMVKYCDHDKHGMRAVQFDKDGEVGREWYYKLGDACKKTASNIFMTC
eukprot:CAMPEP_0194444234 /NCGR_PEP_ID=MMETSP0176-20130528/127154_1 /TAXON_ID=216777 /ORGANISM="Proboscia alata, Strain PI-D3" /LENGTH=64 /DNA_ID=CAMNT_0039270579 /DNA_START=1818 /DNA_END=2009 /DNA_ORIENTATION=-